MSEQPSEIKQVACPHCNGVGRITVPVTITENVDGVETPAETWSATTCEECDGTGAIQVPSRE